MRAADEASALSRDWAEDKDSALRLQRVTGRAHTLAGTAAMLGFTEVSGAAKRLENVIASGQGGEAAQACVADLCQALQRVANDG